MQRLAFPHPAPTTVRRLAAGAAALLATAAAARALPDVWTPHAVAALKSVGTSAISPDGERVAYTVLVPRVAGVDEDGTPWSELWVVGRDDGEPRPFVTGKVDVSSPEWTVDGKGIAFLAKRGDDKFTSLYVIAADGGEARRAASLEGTGVQSFSLAPDGRRVALVGTDPEPEARKKSQEKGFKQEVYEEDWRPARLWIAELFGEAKPRALEVEGTVRRALWSPADERIAISTTPTPLVDDEYVRQRVRVVDAKGGEVLARVENPGKLASFAWSADAKRLALIAGGDEHDPAPGRILVCGAEDGALRELLPGHAGDFAQALWQDATNVMFVGSRGVEAVFGRIAVEGGSEATREILGPGGPALASFSLSKDGKHASFVASTPERPAELWTMSHGDAAPRRRTHLNPVTSELRLAKQEVVRWKARDGLELEGLLIRPLDEVAGRRYPLIVYVHGGPEAHESNGWQTSYSKPGQVAAARGFAVLHPNYRGSTGRGVAFSKLGQGDPAGKEFDDIVDAVDHLVATGLVDPKKVGVTGGSYGGYATAWLSTRYSERFAAGVMFVGISDKISKVGTTDIPDEEFLVHALERPWDNWQKMLERSPIYHAGKSRTPLLILHGKDDPRVHPGQSREMYRHLKLRGEAPVRLVLYPGEGHGNRKAASRLDYHLRMLQWMEHYLQGAGGEPPPYEIDHAEPKAGGETRADAQGAGAKPEGS